MSEPCKSSVFEFTDTICHTAGLSPHLRKDYVKGVEFSLQVSNVFLRELEAHRNNFQNLTYIDIVNTQIINMKLKRDTKHEERLKRACSDLSCKFKKTKSGPGRVKLLKGYRKIAIFQGETDAITHTPSEPLQHCDTNSVMTEARCTELWNSCIANDSTYDENLVSSFRKTWEELGPRQQTRRTQTITEQASKAFSFLDALGFHPMSLNLKAAKDQMTVTLTQTPNEFSELEETRKEKIRCLVGVMDRFGISDAAYNEFAHIFPEMPRSHAVTIARGESSDTIEIHRVPGAVGAYVSFTEDMQNTIRRENKAKTLQKNFIAKISGDGTRVSRISNFVVFSYQISTDKHSSNLSTLAIVNCQENYISIRDSLGKLFEEINNVKKQGEIEVDGEVYGIEVVFSSDMKMIQLMLGLGGSTGSYACPWCRVHKDERWKTDKQWTHFHHDKSYVRTLSDIRTCADNLSFGVKHTPLLDIEVSNFIIDELHMLLRITDVLERNLLTQAQNRDQKQTTRPSSAISHLDKLTDLIRSCGVTFHVWEDKSSQSKLNWTSFTGNDKKKILKKLPSLLQGYLPSGTAERIIKLWVDFEQIHRQLTHGGEGITSEGIAHSARQWLELFLSLGGEEMGYGKSNVTPYMHCLVYHAPVMFHRFGPLGIYSCQGVEK